MSDTPDFASGYARSHRIYETTGIVLGACAFAKLTFDLVATGTISGWWVPLTVFAGLLAADFVSGVVHWLFDTWGRATTPIVGQLAIRTFREHHVDERAMTRHGFVETNGHNVTLSVIPSITGVVALRYHGLPFLLLAMSCFSMALCVAMTSQIHKWAHMESPPRVVRKLQNAGFIIGARHHHRHHVKPHDTHYCITVGWMNTPLEMVRFFRGLEWLITAVTGVEPREEDMEATANVPTPALPPGALESAPELLASDVSPAPVARG
jgi:ubiquitin-conjugating enzyme E2 variant